MLDVLDQMPPAGVQDETDEQRRQRLARLPIPDAMPPAPALAAVPQTPSPEAQAMPPARPSPQQPSNAAPIEKVAPAAPAAMPAGPVAAGPKPMAVPGYPGGEPQLHGWRKALDVVGNMFPIGRAIEQQVPGTPQNFNMRQAMEASRQEKSQGLAKGQQEIEAGASKAQFDTPEKRRAYMQDHPGDFEDTTDFEKNDFILSGKFPQHEPSTKNREVAPASDAYYSLQDTVNPKTGKNYSPEEALAAVQDITKPQKKDAFNEYLTDPADYQKFATMMAGLKNQTPAGAGIRAAYASVKMLDTAYNENPALLPVAKDMIQTMYKQLGLPLPQHVADLIGQTPAAQPMDESGNPIGLRQPGAPTPQTRSQGQMAEKVLDRIPDIRKEVGDLKGYLGPGEGRLNVAFLLGRVGTTGDPQKDQALSGLRTDLTMMATASARFHLNSVRAMEEMERLADAGKDSAPALNGAIDSIEKWAKDAAKQGRGRPLQAPINPGTGKQIQEGDTRTSRRTHEVQVFKGGQWQTQAPR
jgi:hypothetical protein